MMADHKDGGPAFPIPNATDMDGYVYAPEASGMTLRDWFAGQAVARCWKQALWQEKHNAEPMQPAHYSAVANRAAVWAYDIADAMLKARGSDT